MSSKTRTKFLRRTDVKMTIWYIFTFFISSLIICSFLYIRLKHQLIKEVDRMLLDETEEFVEILSQANDLEKKLRNIENNLEVRSFYPLFFRVLAEDGSTFYCSKTFGEIGYDSGNIVFNQMRQGKKILEDFRSAGRRTPYRFVTIPYFKDGELTYAVQIGTHLRFVRKSLSHFKYNLLAAFPIVLVFGALGGWTLARKSLSPIGYIASKAKSITSQNLSQRLTPRGTGDEMDDLIRTINEMIVRLEESFKRMAEFTADASHELKTPICALRGEAEVLLSKARTTGEYQEGLAHFIERSDQLNRMINDLILLSKFDASQAELKMVPVRLDLLIQDIYDLFQVLAEQKNIALSVDSCQETTIMGDKMRLQQLFTNLIDNAVKFTPEKGSIQIRVEKDVDFAQVKVIDTGIGIPKEEQANIFNRFYRVDKSRSKENGGVGLGLSIVEWIVKAHHGEIEIQSELSQGSTFTVYLPLQKA
ncbi:MAG: sensor histidine kinase [Thermodesulfobacteriota bacterium]